MVNHGLIIALLFIVIGWIYERRKTWQANELRGLQRPAPDPGRRLHGGPAGHHRAARAERVRGGVPDPGWGRSSPTGGGPWWPPAGVVVAAIYMLWAYQQAFHHEPDAANAATRDISWREGAIVAPLGCPHHLPGRVPEAGARPDHAVGRPAGEARRPGHGVPRSQRPSPPDRQPVGATSGRHGGGWPGRPAAVRGRGRPVAGSEEVAREPCRSRL